jgi:hypothetical protein
MLLRLVAHGRPTALFALKQVPQEFTLQHNVYQNAAVYLTGNSPACKEVA